MRELLDTYVFAVILLDITLRSRILIKNQLFREFSLALCIDWVERRDLISCQFI
jgi:hypothetical protein